ncbi:3-deoxy-manno-octulosonate cytidylyltransferase [Larsenimonas suaedae]|uniref:3-deoxy-manno-octulosonate cytidylyltransferase n=1 Tax=Larsenimonas suaedae TaxID=1851019 RepID=A0ABU1GUX3_9GAMM|nr:3-deoxy-manno-octulosonate cytidylyltransferase [Larsenimonas suaedae]MCM2971109.1 3-deoxy-manno-octulosonate cytidylyltransferase [Larsenimonas suaedae]MDR5895818.1 3-deoxy-manno-octulosonate cytidylyltransferase [Larsenimonas suaedae]
MSAFVVVIPARFGSTRLPGKPLEDIGGEPMVVRVWRQACASEAARVVIATDDVRIQRAAQASGAEVVMTDQAHPNGTSRLAEVAEQLGLDDTACVVNVQGDEPMIPPELIDQVARALQTSEASISTLAEPITSTDTLLSPSVVKVVCDRAGRALYFSRAPIPWDRDRFPPATGNTLESGWLRHIGLYAYRVGFLRQYVTWSEAPIEGLESLEQLRALYEGHVIQVSVCDQEYPAGVDTEADLVRVRQCFNEPGV